MGQIREFPFENNYIPLSQKGRNSTSNTFSVLIGKNGVGKSRLLSDIAENYSKKISGEDAVYFDSGFTPSKILAISTSPFDKFQVTKNSTKQWHDRYHYVGMKGSLTYANNAMALISSAAKGLLNKCLKSTRTNNLEELFSLLHLEKNLTFIFKLNIKPHLEVAQKPSAKKYILDYEATGIDLYTYSGSPSDEAFRELLEDKAYDAYTKSSSHVKNEIAKSLTYVWQHLETKKNALFGINFDYRNRFSKGFLDKEMVESILALLNAGIVRLLDLKLRKIKNNRDHFQELSLRRASSGEQCLLVIMLGIAGLIEDNALILIDEPEISLHPSWQEKFMSLLMTVFSDYNGCHFIIATHSPQIVSRLASENCFITIMGENKMYSASEYFNRSADYQLTELFDAPGIMNEYITRLAFNLLAKVKANRGATLKDQIEIKKLESILSKLDANDPNHDLLTSVIDTCSFFMDRG
jgi:predicted ATPase